MLRGRVRLSRGLKAQYLTNACQKWFSHATGSRLEGESATSFRTLIRMHWEDHERERNQNLETESKVPLVRMMRRCRDARTLSKWIQETPVTLWEDEAVTQELFEKLSEVESEANAADLLAIVNAFETNNLDIDKMSDSFLRVNRLLVDSIGSRLESLDAEQLTQFSSSLATTPLYDRELMQKIVNVARHKLSSFNAEQFSGLVFDCYECGAQLSGLMAAAQNQIFDNLEKFEVFQLTRILRASHENASYDTELFERAASIFIAKMDDLSEGELRLVTLTYSKCGYRNMALFQAIVAKILDNFDQFQLVYLARLMKLFTRVGFFDESFFDAVLKKALALEDFDPDLIICTLGGSFARFRGGRYSKFFDHIYQPVMERLDEMELKVLAYVAAIYCRAGYRDDELIERVGDILVERMDEFPLEFMETLLDAYTPDGVRGRMKVLNRLADRLVGVMKTWTDEERVRLIYRYATANCSPENLFDAVAHAMSQDLSSLERFHLISLARSYARTRQPYTVIFDKIAAAVIPKWDSFSDIHLILLLHAMCQTGYPYRDLFEKSSARLKDCASMLKPRFLIHLANICACSGTGDKAMMNVVAKHATAAIDSFNGKELHDIAKVFSAFKSNHFFLRVVAKTGKMKIWNFKNWMLCDLARIYENLDIPEGKEFRDAINEQLDAQQAT